MGSSFGRVMAGILLALAPVLTLLSAPFAPTAAADATIGLYADASGSTCSLTGNAPGRVTAFVVVRPDPNGLLSVRFAAPIPACFGATVVEEVTPPDVLSIGDTQTGISLAVNHCVDYPFMALQVTYQSAGTTTPCCEFPIVPEPWVGYLEAIDCAGQHTEVVGLTSHLNADASCQCLGNMAPLPPSDPVPQNFAVATGPSPRLSWDAFDYDHNIAEYDVYLGPSPSPPLAASGLTQPAYAPPAALAPFTRHYWRVVTRDAMGLETSGPVWNFTTRASNVAPNVLENPTPYDGANGVLLYATLFWYAADVDGDPLVFDLYLGTTTTPPLVARNIPSRASYSLVGLVDYGTVYHWRIIARDPSGAEKAGPLWTFATRSSANTPPNPPFNPSPTRGEVLASPMARSLTWVGSDPEFDRLTYDVYFGTSLSPPLVASNLAVPAWGSGPLRAMTEYRWRIVVRDEKGAETSGPLWSFAVEGTNTPPTQASNPDPADGSVSSLSPTLTWTAFDPDGDRLSFDVYMGTSYGNLQPVAYLTVAEYSPGTLLPGTTYIWGVSVGDGWTRTYPGQYWTFTTPPADVLLPVLFTRFEASAVDGGVEAEWELSSDEAVDHFTLYRREGSSTLSTAVTRGPVDDVRQSYLDRAVEGGTTYHYELVVTASDGDEFRSPVATVQTAELTLALYPNHPNPFNPQTTIRYDLPSDASSVRVRLFVLDVAGRVVRTLVDEDQRGGTREVTWDGRDDRGGAVSSGVYFSVLDFGGERRTHKLVLLK